jgi:hypothetical protein
VTVTLFAPSVTRNVVAVEPAPPRLTLSRSTRPPNRTGRPLAPVFATSEGETKKTRLSLKASNTSAVAEPSPTPQASTIHSRRRLRVIPRPGRGADRSRPTSLGGGATQPVRDAKSTRHQNRERIGHTDKRQMGHHDLARAINRPRIRRSITAARSRATTIAAKASVKPSAEMNSGHSMVESMADPPMNEIDAG